MKTEKFIFFSVRKKIEKVNNKGQTFTKAYSARFIDSIRLMNDSLDSHVNNRPNKIDIKSVNTASSVRIVKNAKSVKMML